MYNCVKCVNFFSLSHTFSYSLRTSTETLVRRYSKSNETKPPPKKSSLTRNVYVDHSNDTLGDNSFDREPDQLPRNNSFVNDFEPTQFADVGRNELVTAELQTKANVKPSPMLSRDQDKSDIIHSKNPSTDSAVYGMHESPTERTDSMNELSSINVANFEIEHQQQRQLQLEEEQPIHQLQQNSYLHGDHDHHLPSQTEHFIHDQHENNLTEKEKPQRTIKRKKKEPGAVSSRNNSCVSTDSTTSTGTVDSGIVVRSDLSPRTSPISSGQYYDTKDLSTSRETLDGDVNDYNPHATSTPERHDENSFSRQLPHDDSVGSPGNDSASENNRLDSPAPGMDDLDSEKVQVYCSDVWGHNYTVFNRL